jgi:hypothetical protein
MLMATKVNKLPEWTLSICNFNAVCGDKNLKHSGQATLYPN